MSTKNQHMYYFINHSRDEEELWKPSKFKPETISVETGESSIDTPVDYITDSESEESEESESEEETYEDLLHAQKKRKNAYNQYRKWLKEEKRLKDVLSEKYSDGKDDNPNSPWSTGSDDALNHRRSRPCYYVAIKADPGRIKVPQSKMTQEEIGKYKSGYAYGKVQRKPKKK